MATHSSIVAWRIPWTEEPGGLQSMGCKELETTEQLTHMHIHYSVCACTYSACTLSGSVVSDSLKPCEL